MQVLVQYKKIKDKRKLIHFILNLFSLLLETSTLRFV